MSNRQELEYFERLNISVLSIAGIKDLIKSDITNTIAIWEQKDVQKQCFHIIGPAGVGKTEICYQIANELTEELFGKSEDNRKFEIIMVKAPVLSRDDFIIPFPVIDNGNTSFKMLYGDFVPKGEDSFGLFVIDEFSRGDHSLQQLLWQVQNEYSIHRYDFPKGWFVISIDNPDNQEYSMDTLEDAAGLRRQLHVYTEVSVKDFLDYAIIKEFHPLIIEYIQAHPDHLYDFESQKLGRVYSNPASWEKLSFHLWKFELTTGIDKNFNKIEVLSSGLLNVNKARLFIEFARDKKDISPKDVYYEYEKVRKRVKQFVTEKDNASLGNLMTGFITYLTTSRPGWSEDEKQNVASFLADVPLDTAAIFVAAIDGFDRTSKEFKYLTSLHVQLMKDPQYKVNFYEAIVKCGKDAVND